MNTLYYTLQMGGGAVEGRCKGCRLFMDTPINIYFLYRHVLKHVGENIGHVMGYKLLDEGTQVYVARRQ